MQYPTKWNGGGSETVCGGGSTTKMSSNFRKVLRKILKKFDVKIINDLGCGDGNIYKEVDLSNVDYLGYDIEDRSANHLPTTILDIVNSKYREADLTICRDVMLHLPNEMCESILANARQSSRLLLASTFLCSSNKERISSPSFGYSEINLSIEPFNLKEPLLLSSEHYNNKYIGLWSLE